jgi:hypothetical protein
MNILPPLKSDTAEIDLQPRGHTYEHHWRDNMRTALRRLALFASSAFLIACGGGSPSDPGNQQQALNDQNAAAQRIQALDASQVPMPSASAVPVDAGKVRTAASAAQSQPGSRGPFTDFHDSVAPLLPSPSLAKALEWAGSPSPGTARALALADTTVNVQIICIDQSGNQGVIVNNIDQCIGDPPPPNNPNDPNCPPVCATACAQAEAAAFAAAWAQASATTCAWAQAWACVYNGVFPFNRVCAWAQSQACATAFAEAYAYFGATDFERQCEKRCSDGRVWRWVEAPQQNQPVN